MYLSTLISMIDFSRAMVPESDRSLGIPEAKPRRSKKGTTAPAMKDRTLSRLLPSWTSPSGRFRMISLHYPIYDNDLALRERLQIKFLR
jgi:hypothetical protein